MTVFLHIGSHKTGTTAIQKFAHAPRRKLRNRGLWYPGYSEIGRPSRYGHHHFSHAVANAPRGGFRPEDALRFAEAIRQRRRDGEDVLISAEPIYRHVLGEGDYWQQRRAYVEHLRDVLELDDVVVVAVLRRQDGFARSLYQEKVRAKRYTAPFRQFLVEERQDFEYHRQLEPFADVFGRVDVKVYEDLRDKGLIDAFFQQLGVAVADLRRKSVANPSLPLELVEYKRLLNATRVDMDHLDAAVGKLWKRARAGGLIDDTDWVPRHELEAFCASFDVGNEQVRAQFAGDRPAPLFPSLSAAPIKDRSEYAGMSARRFAQLTAEIFL
ncbi:hypothetical protein [Bauldia sp.]|uniref:hypothetical protein n=1 Tax=Bauldia sp. TaxID=2575872 RepID=UPI003BA86A13